MLRSGKYVQLTEERHGELASKIVSYLLKSGNAQLSDILETCNSDASHQAQDDSATKSTISNGKLPKKAQENGRILRHTSHDSNNIHQVLRDLLQANFIYKVHESFFRTEEDNRAEAEMQTPQIEEYKGAKKDREGQWEDAVQAKLDAWRRGEDKEEVEMEISSGARKRPLVKTEATEANKRARLNGGFGNPPQKRILQDDAIGTLSSQSLKV